MTCPNGHPSTTDDYCSVCGSVMASPTHTAGRTCPECAVPAAADAMFCESCGYDYLTGARPRQGKGSPTRSGVDPVPSPQVGSAESGPTAPLSSSPSPGTGPISSAGPAVAPVPGAVAAPGAPVTVPQSSTGQGYQRRVPAPNQTGPGSGPAAWVAEIWIDPEWHAAQGGPDQLPSPGQPIIVGLRKRTVVIGRSSPSGVPDIDLVTDSGVSRRQASLVTDGRRWFVEDLGSANGTYIGRADAPVPQTPISGRVEVTHHDRILVGSWTRIVVRPALRQEANL